MINTTRFASLGTTVSLTSSFEPIGKGLQQAERSNDIRPFAELRKRQHFALGVGEVRDCEQQRHHDRKNLADSDDSRPSVAGPEASHAYQCALAPGGIAANCTISLQRAIVWLARLIGSVR